MRLFNAYVSIFFISGALNLYAQDSPVFSLGSVSTMNSTTILPITAVNFSNITSGNLKILYDPTVTLPVAVTKGPKLAGTFDYNLSDPGIIRIGWFTFPAVTLSNESVIFNLEFTKSRAGTSAISFDDGTTSLMDCQFYNGSHKKLNDEPFSTYYIPGSLTFHELAGPVTTAPALTATLNEKVNVPITISGFNNVGAVSLKLEYDPAVLYYNSADNTGDFPGMIIYNPAPGILTVSGITNDPNGYSLPDESTFFSLNFTYLGGTTVLRWIDDGKTCEYAGTQSTFVFLDTPQSEFYINGRVSQLPTPDAPILSLTHPTCEISVGSIEVTSPINTEYSYSVDGINYQPSPIFNNLNDGTYKVTVKNYEGYVSFATSAIINEQPPTPVHPVIELTAASCDAPGRASLFNYNESYTYAFTPEGPGTDASGTITGFITGESYIVTAISTDECVSAPSEPFIIEDGLEVPEQPVFEIIAPTCDVPGNASIINYNASYTYTFTPAGPVTDSRGKITGFNTEQPYMVTANSINECVSTPSGPFIIEDGLEVPEQPVVEIIAPTCDVPGNASIINYNASYTYTFTPAGPVTDASGIITGFNTEQPYMVTANSSNGCVSTPSEPYIIEDAGELPEQPVVEIISATCNVPGSASIINYNASFTYTFTPAGPVADGSGNITGVSTGQSHTVKGVSNNGCESAVSEPFTINDAFELPGQPIVDIVAPTCDAPGSASITNFNATHTYIFTPEGPVADANSNIAGCIAGLYYTITANSSNGCVSTISESFTIDDILEAPVPIVSVYGPDEFCKENCITLTASEGEKYLWSTGETTQSIFAKTTGDFMVEVTYENGCSALSLPTSVIISNSQQIEAINEQMEIKVYPNPFSEKLSIEFISPESADACVKIYDVNGRFIKTIFNCNVEEGRIYKAEFKPNNLTCNAYYYKLTLGNYLQSGKIIYRK